MSGNIFFLGNALLDISIECDSSLLTKYNLKSDENIEVISENEDLFDFLLNNPSSLISPGGSAQNSARIAQSLFDNLGTGQATFLGCIGNDVYGKKLLELMESSKLRILYHNIDNAATGITAALATSDGKRSLCARLGAAALFETKYITSNATQSAIHSANIIYIEGYLISHSPLCAIDVATLAKSLSKQLVINLSASYICDKHLEPLNKCVALADIVIGNKQEAKVFVSKHGHPADSALSCAKIISALTGKPDLKRIVIITQGPDPVVIVRGETAFSEYNVPPIEAIGDTIGCGDAFVGGFLAMMSLGQSIDTSVKIGIHCATLVAQQRGCMLPPDRIELGDIKF